jgi:hypothetical protein
MIEPWDCPSVATTSARAGSDAVEAGVVEDRVPPSWTKTAPPSAAPPSPPTPVPEPLLPPPPPPPSVNLLELMLSL